VRRIGRDVPSLPVFVKINGTDNRPGGMRIAEAVRIAQLLQAAGCSAIEVSRGVSEDGLYFIPCEQNPIDAVFHYNFKVHAAPRLLRPLIRLALRRELRPQPPTRLYNVPAAEAIKAAVSIPVMVVGGIRTMGDIRSILDQGQADLVSICRPFILEPNLVEKFRTGKQTDAKCLYCDYCALGIEQAPLRCHFGKLREGKDAASVRNKSQSGEI